MQLETTDLLDLVNDAWEEAYAHSATVAQLLYEYNASMVPATETIDKINEATRQYHSAFGRYKKASEEFRTVLADRLN